MGTADFERYLSFISSELQPARAGRQVVTAETSPRLAITLSRQSGSGAHRVAELLSAYLQTHIPGNRNPWLVFDRNLAERVLEENNLPKHLARFMPEDKISAITDVIDEMFGLHPPFWTLVQKTSETIFRLAEQGNVIVIGRGSNMVTQPLKHVFHVRLTGSVEKRVAHVQLTQGVDQKEALRMIHREDGGRERYLKRYFGKSPDDPLLYHLVINTDLVAYEAAARIIGEAAVRFGHQTAG